MAVLQVKDLYPLASQRSCEEFVREMGPFVLIQRPPAPVLAKVAAQLGEGRTVVSAHRARLANEIMAMLVGFKYLQVANLPSMTGPQTLVVGRLPDCGILVEEPSVSKRHALLSWDARRACCYLRDLGSMNGTFVNTRQIHGEDEVPLSDGDALSFGDAQFLFMLSDSLHAQLLSCGLDLMS